MKQMITSCTSLAFQYHHCKVVKSSLIRLISLNFRPFYFWLFLHTLDSWNSSKFIPDFPNSPLLNPFNWDVPHPLAVVTRNIARCCDLHVRMCDFLRLKWGIPSYSFTFHRILSGVEIATWKACFSPESRIIPNHLSFRVIFAPRDMFWPLELRRSPGRGDFALELFQPTETGDASKQWTLGISQSNASGKWRVKDHSYQKWTNSDLTAVGQGYTQSIYHVWNISSFYSRCIYSCMQPQA